MDRQDENPGVIMGKNVRLVIVVSGKYMSWRDRTEGEVTEEQTRVDGREGMSIEVGERELFGWLWRRDGR